MVGAGAMTYGSWIAVKYSMSLVAALYAKPHLVMYLGFCSGFTTATICAALAFSLYRLTHIRPENAFNQTFAAIKQSNEARNLLGEHIRDAKLKSYALGNSTEPAGAPSVEP